MEKLAERLVRTRAVSISLMMLIPSIIFLAILLCLTLYWLIRLQWVAVSCFGSIGLLVGFFSWREYKRFRYILASDKEEVSALFTRYSRLNLFTLGGIAILLLWIYWMTRPYFADLNR